MHRWRVTGEGKHAQGFWGADAATALPRLVAPGPFQNPGHPVGIAGASAASGRGQACCGAGAIDMAKCTTPAGHAHRMCIDVLLRQSGSSPLTGCPTRSVAFDLL